MDGWVSAAGVWVLLGGLLTLSAGFSGAESALFSLAPADLMRCRARGGAAGRAVLALHADLRRVLLTLLFCNMLVNVLFFAVSTLRATRAAAGADGGPAREALAALAALATVLLAGEVLPKNAALAAPLAFARLTAPPLLALHKTLARFLVGFDRCARFAVRACGLAPGGRAAAALAAEELRLLIDISRADGILSSAEGEWLERVVTLPGLQLRDVMTHRVDAVWVDAGAPVAAAIELALAAGHARLPVRDPATDEWIGWVDARALALAGDAESGEGKAAPVRRHLHAPLWLSELDRADQALERLLSPAGPLAFVVDERGAATGLATQSDLLSELFGDFGGGTDEAPAREAPGGGWVLPGSASVYAWRRWLGEREDMPDCATVGGLVTLLLGRPARRGDRVRWRNVRLEVLSVARHRPAEVLLRVE